MKEQATLGIVDKANTNELGRIKTRTWVLGNLMDCQPAHLLLGDKALLIQLGLVSTMYSSLALSLQSSCLFFLSAGASSMCYLACTSGSYVKEINIYFFNHWCSHLLSTKTDNHHTNQNITHCLEN